jgi:osmotically-inducible protein OsmY
MKLIALSVFLMTVVFGTGCVIVVDGTDDSPDAHWMASYESDSDARRESNDLLARKVSDRLAEETSFDAEDISVSASHKVVTLHGRLHDMASLEQVVDLAGGVDGVERVVSRITLDVRGS